MSGFTNAPSLSSSGLTVPGMSYVPGTTNTRRVTMALCDSASAFGGNTTYLDLNCRYALQLPVTPTRIRFRWKNSCLNTGTTQAGTTNITGVWAGPLPRATQAQWSGAFSQAPTLVGAAQSIDTSVTEYVTAWTSISSLPWYVPNEPFGVSFGINALAAVPLNFGNSSMLGAYGTNCSLAANAGASAFNAAAGTAFWQVPIGDLRIEIEYQGSNMIGLHIGDSVTSGYSSVASNSSFTSGTVGCPGPFNKWPEKAAAKLGTLAINGGIGGTNTGNSPTFLGPWQTSTAPAYTRFDLTTTVPDFACISLGTNDSQSTGIGSLSNYTSLTQYQTNMLAIISTLNGLGIKRIYATTIPPNGQAAGPLTAAVVAGGSSVTVAQPVGYTTDAPNPWALPGGSTTVAGVYNLASLPTTITLTSTAGFSTTGGFVSLGSLGVISYSGVSGATLTGCTTIVGSGSTVSGTTTAIGSYLAGIELGGAANPLVEGFYVSGVSTAAGVVTLTLGGGRTLANAHAIGVTVMNQAEYNRQQYNAWLRTGCSGLDGVFDLASVVEGPMFTGVAGGGGFAGSVVNGAMLNPYYGQVNSQDLHPSGPGWHAAVAQAFSTFIIGI